MRVFQLSTAHGTCVLVDTVTGHILHGLPDGQRYQQALFWWPDDRRDCGFLISPVHVAALKLDGDVASSSVIGVKVTVTGDDMISLRHPISGLVVCAVLPVDGEGQIIADRAESGAWEDLSLVVRITVPDYAVSVVSALQPILTSLSGAAQVLAFLNAPPSEGVAAYFEACLRLLPLGEMGLLGRALLSAPQAVAVLARLMPNDVWFTRALPDLLAYRSNSHGAEPVQSIDQTFDHLAVDGAHGRFVSAGQMVNAFARRNTTPAKGICIVAAARNEGLYLPEWIAYHRALGVDDLFLYTNDNDDGSDYLLQALADSGLVRWIKNVTDQGVSPQMKAYGHAFQILPEILDYRWAIIIDIDEFIVLDINKFDSLPDFLGYHDIKKSDAIALNWVMFGSGGALRRTGERVTSRFLHREPVVNPHVKAICHPALFIHSHCHYPISDRSMVFNFNNASGVVHEGSATGDRFAFSAAPSDEFAWLNHYHTKSAEEYILRRSSSRGDMALALKPSGEFFSSAAAAFFVAQHRGAEFVVDGRAVAGVPTLQSEMAALLALPGVAEAMAAIERAYYLRLGALRAALESDLRFNAPGSAEQWFAEILNDPASMVLN